MPPILDNKNTSSPSVFVPSALLRAASRQKNIPAVQVPSVCLMDPDDDLVRGDRSRRFQRIGITVETRQAAGLPTPKVARLGRVMFRPGSSEWRAQARKSCWPGDALPGSARAQDRDAKVISATIANFLTVGLPCVQNAGI
jgi:hypothetical protein